MKTVINIIMLLGVFCAGGLFFKKVQAPELSVAYVAQDTLLGYSKSLRENNFGNHQEVIRLAFFYWLSRHKCPDEYLDYYDQNVKTVIKRYIKMDSIILEDPLQFKEFEVAMNLMSGDHDFRAAVKSGWRVDPISFGIDSNEEYRKQVVLFSKWLQNKGDK
jgi:hypothetical protein